jgi:AraC family transcriptional regulator
MQAKIVRKPAFSVVGMSYHGKNQHNEIPQLWRSFGPRMGEVQHVAHPENAYGVMDHLDARTGEFDYLAAFEVTTIAEIAEGMTVKAIPAQTYAVFPCMLSTLRQTYAAIYQDWMPNSGYQRAGGPEFELYDERFTPDDPNSEMFLYIPVERSNGG